MEYLHLWHKLRELFGKAGAIVGIVAIMVCLAFGEAIIKQIGDRIEPQWTELVGPVNLCAPSNASELKARQIDACRIQEGQTIAMMELSRGAEIRYDSPPKTYFSAFILQGSMFMKKAGGKLRIYALNREGLEMRVDNEFRVTENLSAGPDQLIGTGNPKFYRFERGQLDELKEMQNSLTFTGYTTFRRPDFERFSAQMGLSGIEFDHTLVQSHAEHRPDDVDKQVAQTFHHQAPATTTPFEKITSIRIVALSEEPVIVRLDSLERLSHSATSIDTTVLSGQVVVPRGVSYESVNIHIEPVELNR